MWNIQRLYLSFSSPDEITTTLIVAGIFIQLLVFHLTGCFIFPLSSLKIILDCSKLNLISKFIKQSVIFKIIQLVLFIIMFLKCLIVNLHQKVCNYLSQTDCAILLIICIYIGSVGPRRASRGRYGYALAAENGLDSRPGSG